MDSKPAMDRPTPLDKSRTKVAAAGANHAIPIPASTPAVRAQRREARARGGPDRPATAADDGSETLVYAPERLREGIAALGSQPVFAGILERAGPPRFRRRRNGF